MGLTQRLGTIPLAIQTDSSNNVGIGGAANASYKLAVTGTGSLTGNLAVGGTTNDTSGGLYSNIAIDATSYSRYSLLTSGTARGRFQFDGTNTSMLATSTGGKLQLQTLGANAMEFYTNDALRATITSSGNVGIGTILPNRILEVATGGDTYLRVTGNRGNADDLHIGNVEFYNSNTTRIIAEVRAITGTGGTQSNSGQLAFYTNNAGTYAERMRITSGGQVQIKQSANTFADGFRLISSNSIYWGLVVGGDNNLYLGYNSPSASIGVFNYATGIYTATSDINKKKDFEDSTIGLNAILGLKPKLFRMKSENNEVEKSLGFIAQEVKEFIPQAYVDSNNFIGLNDRPIIAALVKAIQEMNTKLNEQNQTIQNLQDRLDKAGL